MKHILLNPHNGSHVEHEGVVLPAGHALHVLKNVGEALIQRFPFLLLQVVPGDDKGVAKAKAGKIKGRLEWQHHDPSILNETTGDAVPLPQEVTHVVTESAKVPAAKKKAAKKKSRK